MLHGSLTNMSLANATSGDACEPLNQFPRPSEAHLQLPATNTINDPPISGEKQQAEVVAQIPTLVVYPSFSVSQGKEQSGSQATTSSQVLSLQEVTTFSPAAKIKVDQTEPDQVISQAALDTDGSKLAQAAQAAPSTPVAFVEIGGGITGCEAIMSSDRAPSSENVGATPTSSITEKACEMTGMSHEEALAFLNCHSLVPDEKILTGFSNKTWDYPATVNFARQAVKIIAKERESKALLNWLDTGILKDPELSGDKVEHLPVIDHPFWWRIEDGEHGYPPDSIGQESGNNTYLCSKPMSVTVGPSGVTYYVHKNVLALSRVLERMCETAKAKETGRITLPDDEPSVFEHLLGYLYFQKFNPPVQETGWPTDLEQPSQKQPHADLANDIIIKTYVVAAKYGVDRLKPVLLKSLEIGTIEELYSSAKTVYDANADDGDFRGFFKKELMVKLEKALDDGLYDPYVSLTVLNTLSGWGSFGGHLGADVTWALANKVCAKHKLDREDEISQKCEACGEMECHCEMGTCEDNETPASYYDNQFGHREWGDKIYPSTNNKDNNASCEEPQQDSNINNLSKEIRELTDKMSYLVAQLGNNQGLGSAEGLRQTKAVPLWQAAGAPKHLGEQIEGGSVTQGPPNEQGPTSWGTPLPALLRRQLHPLMQNRSTSESQTAVAIQTSNPWDCSITFPTGAIITNVRPTLDRDGESYLVGCCGGLYGSFPARYVHMLQ